jgi:tungstate transport system ATP-binding protein
MSAVTFRLEGVTKRYDGREVLTIEDLAIHRGDLFAVVGPSGAGKSTLLRLLNFLEAPSSGSIRFAGASIGCDGAVPLHLRRRVTTVFQRPILLKRSVWANVAYGLRLRGCRELDDRVHGALDQVGLSHLARQKAGTLSGGEAQRVALARALVLEPEVLLLDEPTANLDPYNVSLIEEIVRTLNDECGTTIVLVTHNVFQARRLARRVGLLLNGSLIEECDVDTFFASPRDPRTRTFVEGRMVY